MKSKYLERIEEAYKQFELFSVKKQVNNGDYLILLRNANEDYDISEIVTNDGHFADTIFDIWCKNANEFKVSNNNGRYIVIMLLKQNDNYQLINDYRTALFVVALDLSRCTLAHEQAREGCLFNF